MRRLTLMRHGEARWKDAETEDFARPLSRRGISAAEAMAERLRELGLIPDRVITSPAHRTEQTADIVARELALPARHVLRDEGLYLASARDLMKIIHGTGPRIAHLMIIGHNPGVSELAQLLAPEAEPRGLEDAALCSIAFETDQWPSIGQVTVNAVCRESPPTRFFGWFG
jgi:phosphohistidine phosphatase